LSTVEQDSGRPKGFAFVEYHEADTALAAIRHLNNYDLHGKQVGDMISVVNACIPPPY
jgi:RNA recognition motif-containing protein